MQQRLNRCPPAGNRPPAPGPLAATHPPTRAPPQPEGQAAQMSFVVGVAIYVSGNLLLAFTGDAL